MAFEMLKDYCRPPYLLMLTIMLRLLGATIVIMHETTRKMNMCHSTEANYLVTYKTV